jgi:hypothetical protein
MARTTEIRVAAAALNTKAAEIRGEIRRLAAYGDVVACDVLHGQIGVLEEAMAILLDEDQPFAADDTSERTSPAGW